jgi:hypothetical protein
MLENEQIRRWWENNRVRSPLSDDVLLRNIGLYCEINKTSPDGMLKDAESGELKKQFSGFARKMEKGGKAGSYTVKFKHAIRNWLNFNVITASFNGIYTSGEYENPKLRGERVPSKDELSCIIRKAASRGRVAIAIVAYSGLRPESLGDYEGTDCLRQDRNRQCTCTDNCVFEAEQGKKPVLHLHRRRVHNISEGLSRREEKGR